MCACERVTVCVGGRQNATKGMFTYTYIMESKLRDTEGACVPAGESMCVCNE